MAKRPDTMGSVAMALELLQRIPPRAMVTAEDLHQQLKAAGIDRDLRTIQRQLTALTAHFDIERIDHNRPYRYRWKEKGKGLSLPGLGPRESLILALAEQQLKQLLPAQLMKSMEGFFAQARRNLDPTSNAVREREWLKKVRVVSATQPLLPPKLKPGVFEAVSDAVYGNCWLAVDYMNSAGSRTKSDIMPLGLAQQGPRMYLVCRFRGYDDNRILALNRIQSARATTLTFDRPKNFDLEKYDADGKFGYGEGKKIRLSFVIDKDAGFHLTESPLSSDQVVQDLGNKYRIIATVVQSLLLEQWIRGFGRGVSSISRRRILCPSAPKETATP